MEGKSNLPGALKMRMTVMKGWPGDVLSLLMLALHWEMRMTVMEG
jgi:hypothetical protein